MLETRNGEDIEYERAGISEQSESNYKTYDNCAWSITCAPDAVLTPHALAVNPELQGKGIGKVVVENILNLARAEHKKLYAWMSLVPASRQNDFI